MIRKRPAALFDAVGRQRLAEVIVWGDRPTARPRSPLTIEQRIIQALEKIAAEMEDDK